MLGAILVYGLFVWGCVEGLRRPWAGLILFYSFVVLEPTWNWRWAINTTFPYQKYMAGCILLGLFLNGCRRSKVTGPTYYALACLVGFVGIAYLSTLQTLNLQFSLEYMGYIWKIVLMAVLTVWLIDSPKKLLILIWMVIVCQGYNAYQINLQYFQDGYCRYSVNGWGSKGDNNLYSIFTVPVMALAAAMAVYGRDVWQRTGAAAVMVMQMHVLMLLESRGTMIGGLVLAFIFAVIVPKTERVWRLIGIAALAGALLAGPSVVSEFSSAFSSDETRDSSADSRFLVWKAGAIITRDNPFIGVGPNAGRFLVPQYVPSESTREHKALHNLLFEISTGVGIPGTLLYLAFYGLIFWECLMLLRRKYHDLPDWAAASCLAVICGVPGYWAASMFSSGAVLESSYLLVSIGGAALMIHQRQEQFAAKTHIDIELTDDNPLFNLKPNFATPVL